RGSTWRSRPPARRSIQGSLGALEFRLTLRPTLPPTHLGSRSRRARSQSANASGSTAAHPSAPEHGIRSFRRLPSARVFAHKAETPSAIAAGRSRSGGFTASNAFWRLEERRPLSCNRSGLVQQFYQIAFVQHAFDDNCTVHSGRAIVSLRYG